MKKLFAVFMLLGFLGVSANAEEKGYPPPSKPSVEFARIEALEGKWEGASKHGNGTEEKVTVEYHTSSGGSAVTETIFAGTPHEMVSVYFDENGKLVMTHYCMLGNKPTLGLEKSDASQISLNATIQTRAALMGQMYMNSLTLDQPSKDELVQTWGGVGADGKPSDPTVISLKRV